MTPQNTEGPHLNRRAFETSPHPMRLKVSMRWLVRGGESVPRGLDWLAPYELERLGRMRLAKRREEYLLRRLVAKEAIAAATGLAGLRDLARIEIRNAPNGAPFVLLDGEPAKARISLTDRAAWAVCLLSEEAAGCDLELVEPRSAGFVNDFLTRAERSYVDAATDGAEAANLIWSAKESALKVLRTGLRLDTREVEVTVLSGQEGGWSPLRVGLRGGRRFPGWWRRGGGFVLTVVCRTEAPPPLPFEAITGPFSTPAPR